MGKKKILMLPANEVDLSNVNYQYDQIQAPHLTGIWFKLFVKLMEFPLIGSFIVNHLKNQNKMTQLLKNTVIPEPPMFRPEFPPQEPEIAVVPLEDGNPAQNVQVALKCLPDYDPASCWNGDLSATFRYWRIRDYAYAYRSKLTTPSIVAENFISAMQEFNNHNPNSPLLISFDTEDIRKQAAASTQRFEEGAQISILDGIFMAIKDDIDCCPHPTKGATTWYHKVRQVQKDSVSVSRLRSCGVILVGKANMHELGMGTTGNNPNYGTTRNPHAPERYTGGSSSGPAAIVASGLCSAALGTDGGGSVRIPASLCGTVGLKTTYGRTDLKGSLCYSGTVEIIGPITSTVEDSVLVYAAILGSSSADKIALKPLLQLNLVHENGVHKLDTGNVAQTNSEFLSKTLPCLPNLSSHENLDALNSMRLGKYTEWFNDVFSTEVSFKCEAILNRLCERQGCRMEEVSIPELLQMRTAHVVAIGSETLCSLNPDIEDGKGSQLTYDSRTNFALFKSFSASDYVASQCLRRRMMYYFMQAFNKVDVIVTPTTGMTAPIIPPSALQSGETDLVVSGSLMRFVVPANLLGFPAITVPVGYDKEGLPIGLQLIGRPWCEASILRLAAAIEELCSEPKKKPLQFYDILKGN